MHPTSLGVTASARGLASLAAHPAPPFTLAGDTRSVSRAPYGDRCMSHDKQAAARRRIRILIVGALSLACASCGGFESIPISDPGVGDLVGYQVRATMTDGRTLVFLVIDVTDDALVGEFERARFEDVAVLERREYYAVETVGTVALILGAVALLLGLLYSGAG